MEAKTKRKFMGKGGKSGPGKKKFIKKNGKKSVYTISNPAFWPVTRTVSHHQDK